MALATLSIDLIAKIAQFEQDMGQAARISELNAARIDKAMSGIGKAVAGLGIAALVSGQLQGVRDAIDKLDALDDLSEKTGIAASTLSALGYASEVAGTSTDSLGKGLTTLAKNMAAAAGGNTNQIATFKALGVEYKNADGTLRATDQVLLDLADKFSGYSDGASKSADATRLFKGEGQAMIPILDKGREGVKALTDEAKAFGLVVSDDAAKAAGDFNDNLKRFELAGKAFKLTLAQDMIPKLLEFTQQLLAGRIAYGSFLGALLDQGLHVNPFNSLDENIKTTRDELAKTQTTLAEMQARADRIANGTASLGDKFNDIGSDRQRGKFADAAATLQKRLDYFEKLKALQNSSTAPAEDKPPAPVVNTKALTDAESLVKRTDKAYATLVATMKEKSALADVEIDTGQRATAADQLHADVLKTLNDATLAFTPAQRSSVLLDLQQTEARIKLSERIKEQIQLMTQDARATAARLTSIFDENKALQEQFEEVGLTSDQLDDLRISRLKNAEAMQEEKLAAMELFGATADQIAQQQLVIDGLKKGIAARTAVRDATKQQETDPLIGASQGVQDYLKTVEDAGKATRDAVNGVLNTLENDLTTGLASGHLSVKNTVNQMIEEILRLGVVRPMLQNLLGGLSGTAGQASGLAGLLGKFFGGGSSSGGSSGLGSYVAGAADVWLNAKGNIFENAALTPFALGGVFDSPHFFKFANGGAPALGVLGEAGPEAIMPLKRGRDGKLGIASGGGGGGAVNHITYNIGAGVSRGELMTVLQQHSRQIKGEILQSQRDRGVFSRGF